MAEIVLLIFEAVAGVREIAKQIKATDCQAYRLSERVAAIETPLRESIPGIGHELCSSEPLTQLLNTVSEVRDFLARYVGTEEVARALKRKPNAETFTLLGTALSHGIQALHLSISMGAWAQEDVVDRLEDIENMIESMTDKLASMEENKFVANCGRNREMFGDVTRALRVSARVQRTIINKHHILIWEMIRGSGVPFFVPCPCAGL